MFSKKKWRRMRKKKCTELEGDRCNYFTNYDDTMHICIQN